MSLHASNHGTTRAIAGCIAMTLTPTGQRGKAVRPAVSTEDLTSSAFLVGGDAHFGHRLNVGARFVTCPDGGFWDWVGPTSGAASITAEFASEHPAGDNWGGHAPG